MDGQAGRAARRAGVDSDEATRGALGALFGATIAAGSMVGVAAADDISNNLDASVEAVAEVDAADVGGPNGRRAVRPDSER